ncbi:MAG: hypothetical protein GWP61_25380 [Chloroflexi bacterium]|jgi:hypothetical protein|nr:hypothetical protein [Chloroflexota bacterium]
MTKRSKRDRKFPIQPALPGDDDTLIYKIFVDTGPGAFDSSYLVIGETVFLSTEGIEIVASTDGNYADQNAYTFRDSDGRDIGGVYGRDDTGQNVIGIRAVDPPAAGDDVFVELVAHADPTNVSTAAATVNLQATREGESTDTFITVTKDNSSSEIDITTKTASGRVRVHPVLNIMGRNFDLCDVYIKGSNFIIKYNDGGTTRYKYLDLSGTGTTWSHSSTEPS